MNVKSSLFSNIWIGYESWSYSQHLEEVAELNLNKIIIAMNDAHGSSAASKKEKKQYKKMKALYASSRKKTKKTWNSLTRTIKAYDKIR